MTEQQINGAAFEWLRNNVDAHYLYVSDVTGAFSAGAALMQAENKALKEQNEQLQVAIDRAMKQLLELMNEIDNPRPNF